MRQRFGHCATAAVLALYNVCLFILKVVYHCAFIAGQVL
jgi:hypothetical protein